MPRLSAVKSFPVLAALLAAALLAGCAGTPRPDLAPAAGDLQRLQNEAATLSADSTSAALLTLSRNLESAARGRAEAEPAMALAGLREAAEAASAAVLAAVAAGRDAEGDACAKRAADARRDWEDALQMLERTEKVAGRQARGVTREVAPAEPAVDLPAPPPAPVDSAAVAGALQAAGTWEDAAARYAVPAADLANARLGALDAAGAPKLDPAAARHQRRLAAWAVVRLAWRVRGEAARLRCVEASAREAELADNRDQALWAMVDLERSMKDSARRELEEERARQEDRQNALYEQLKQFEGKFASIRREARGTVMSLSDILFDFDQAVLRREAELNLAKVAVILEQYPEMHIRIEGHTDNVGTEAYNQKLSERRARAVYDFLVSQGVPADRMETVGFGMSQPVASNETPEGRQKNRRVDLVIREQ